MTPKDVVSIVLAEPFRPFRIHMASGKTYEIRHPEIVQVGKSNLTIFTPMLDDDEGEGNQALEENLVDAHCIDRTARRHR